MTLTNLSFLEIGQDWIPASEKCRIAMYELNHNLYCNEHSAVLDTMLNVIYPDKADNENVKRVFINLYRATSKLWGDLLFSENPRIEGLEGENKSFIDEIIKNNKLWKQSLKVAIDVSRYGNGVYKVRRNEQGNAVIEPISPRIWYPVVSQDNINEVQAHVLAYVFTLNKVSYLKTETHTKGQIEHKLFILSQENHKIKQQIDLNSLEEFANLKPVEDTGIDDFLVVPVENSMDSESVFGEDDYTDINPIIAEIECQLTKYGQDLKEQGNLKYAPVTAFDENGNIKRNGVIPMMGGANTSPTPGAVTWSVAHEAIKAYIDQLMFFFYVCSETSPAIFSPDVSIGNLSGTAIKRLMQRLLLKAGRLAENFDESLTRVLTIASKLEGKDITGFNIKFNDGLQTDMNEKAQIASTSISAGVMSKKTGISLVQELEGEALDAELMQIESEKKEESATALDNLFPSDVNNDATNNNPA